MKARSRILIGIPSCKRPEGLRRLLASIAAQQGLHEVEVELFVADNDPSDREASELCRGLASGYRWPLHCAVVEERGISAARNAILDRARTQGADFVAMLDDDEEADPRWLEQLLAMQRRVGADVVGGPVEYSLEGADSAEFRASGAFRPRQWAAGPVAMIDATGNVLLSCHALGRLGWPSFDAQFGNSGGEDKEYFWRLRNAGASFAWQPAAVAVEHVPPDRMRTAAVLQRAYRIGNCDLRITHIHGGRAGVLASASRALLLIATAPLMSPVLLLRSRRLWLLRKWARAAGKVSALSGRRPAAYAAQIPR